MEFNSYQIEKAILFYIYICYKNSLELKEKIESLDGLNNEYVLCSFYVKNLIYLYPIKLLDS